MCYTIVTVQCGIIQEKEREHEKCIIYDDKENVRWRHAEENDMTQIIGIKR